MKDWKLNDKGLYETKVKVYDYAQDKIEFFNLIDKAVDRKIGNRCELNLTGWWKQGRFAQGDPMTIEEMPDWMQEEYSLELYDTYKNDEVYFNKKGTQDNRVAKAIVEVDLTYHREWQSPNDPFVRIDINNVKVTVEPKQFEKLKRYC